MKRYYHGWNKKRTFWDIFPILRVAFYGLADIEYLPLIPYKEQRYWFKHIVPTSKPKEEVEKPKEYIILHKFEKEEKVKQYEIYDGINDPQFLRLTEAQVVEYRRQGYYVRELK